MKILQNIAITLCIIFTILDLGTRFLVWSGLLAYLSSPVVNTTNGGFLFLILFLILFMGAVCFTAGFDIAKSKYDRQSLDKEAKNL